MNYYNPYTYQQPYNNYQQSQPQTTYHPLTFVSGLVGAQAFIVSPGQTVYLMDSQNKMLYIKAADNQGRYTLQSFALTDTNNKPAIDIDSFNTRLIKLEEAVYNAKQSNATTNTNDAIRD